MAEKVQTGAEMPADNVLMYRSGARGIVCIPTHADVAPNGWGAPYEDEDGNPISGGLGTPSGGGYSNSPYVIVSPKAQPKLTRKTRHEGEPWDMNSPQAYGTVGNWSREKDAVSWSNRQSGGVLYSWVFYKGKPVFYLQGSPSGNPVTVSAASVFGGRIVVVGHSSTAINVYSMPKQGLTADQAQGTDFSAYLVASYSVTYGYSKAHVSPLGSKFVFIGSDGIHRVSLSVADGFIQSSFSQQDFPEDSDEFGVRNLLIEGILVEFFTLYLDGATGPISNGSGNVVGDYGYSTNEGTETTIDTVPAFTRQRQVGMVWDGETEIPLTGSRTYSMSLTIESSENLHLNYNAEGHPDWENTNDRDGTRLSEYSLQLDDEEKLSGSGFDVVIKARHVQETGGTTLTETDITLESPSTHSDGSSVFVRNSAGTLVEIDSDVTISDDASVIDIATRKVTRTYTFDYSLTSDYSTSQPDTFTYVISCSVECVSEYTARQLVLQGNSFAEVAAGGPVNSSITKSDTTQAWYGATTSNENAMFMFGWSGAKIYGNLAYNPIGCMFAPWPTDFSVVNLDPGDVYGATLYPNSDQLSAATSEIFDETPNIGSPDSWGSHTFSQFYNYQKSVTLRLTPPVLLDNPMAGHGPTYAASNDVLLYADQAKTRPLGDLVANPDETAFITSNDNVQNVPVLYLTGVGGTGTASAFFGLDGFDLSKIELKYKSVI